MDKSEEGINVGKWIERIITILFFALVIYGIYAKFIFVPTCDCQATYAEVCRLANVTGALP